MPDPRALDAHMPMTDRFRASQEGIEQAVQRVMAGIAVFYLGAIAAWSIDRTASAIEWALALGGMVILAITALRGWRTQLTVTDLVASLGALIGALTIRALADEAVTGGPAFAFMTYAALLAAVVLTQHAFLATIALIAAIYVGGRVLQSGLESWPAAIDECGAHLSMIVAGRLVLNAYRRNGTRADTAARARFHVQQEEIIAHAQATAAAERRRFIHDDVIAALVTIQHATSAAQALRAASSAMSALRRSPSELPDSLTEIEWTHDADMTIDVDFDIDLDLSGQPSSRMPPMAAGVTTAIREALRNVQRHSGATKARVRIASEDDVLTVTIRDDGRGFDPERSSGFGIKESIHARMIALGGRATIDSAPGRGTVVTLTWSDRPGALAPNRHLPSIQAMLRKPLRFTTLVTATASVGPLWLAARHVDSSSPWQAAVALTIMMIGLNATVAVFAARHPVGPPHLIAMAAVSCGLLACGILLSPAGSLQTYGAWMLGLACVVIITVASFVPFWSVIALAGSLSTVVALYVAADSDVLLHDAAIPLLRPFVCAAAIGAVAAGFRSASERARRLEAGTGHAIVEGAHALARQAAAEEFDLRTEPELHSFFDQLVSGRLDPQASDVRERARVLALQTRDELYLPGVLDDDLRFLLATTRTTGAQVTIHPSDDTRPNDRAARLLRAGIDPSRAESATLTLPDRQFPFVRLVVIPALTEEHYLRLEDELADLDPDVERLGSASVITVHVGHSHDWSTST